MCIFMHTQTCMHVYTHSHPDTELWKNPLPLFPIITTELIHPWFWLTWNLTEGLSHSAQICFQVPKDFRHNQPKPRQTSVPNLEMLRNNAAPSRNNSDLPQGRLLGSLDWAPISLHRAGGIISCGPTHKTTYLPGGVEREWWWWKGW